MRRFADTSKQLYWKKNDDMNLVKKWKLRLYGYVLLSSSFRKTILGRHGEGKIKR